jgi:alpha-amylase
MQGIPCVFYPDFYGVSYRDEKKVVNIHRVPKLRKLMKARKYLAYGEQNDAFINERLIAWTRSGIEEKKYSGLCVLLNITDRKEKVPLCVGCGHANKEFVELIGGGRDVVKTDGEGKAAFLARPGHPSVWIRKEAMSYFEKK